MGSIKSTGDEMSYFSEVKFNSKNHHYQIKDKSLISATTLVARLEPDVDWEEKAKGVAIREGTTTDLILKKWEENRDKAAHKGTEIHDYIERVLKYNTEKDAKYLEMLSFHYFWEKAKEKLTPKKIEWRIGDYDLGIGGTIDCLFDSSVTNKAHIFDWKTNKKFTSQNPWQNLKAPFDDLEDCHLNNYSLQLSIYKLILRRNTDLLLGDSYIIWLNSEYSGEFYTKIKALDFTDRVEKWILESVNKSIDK